MNEYYQNTLTKIIYRVYVKSDVERIVFKRTIKQYFDGLWEYETVEENIGTFKTKDECFEAMT